jgi:hypothetical protein
MMKVNTSLNAFIMVFPNSIHASGVEYLIQTLGIFFCLIFAA